MRVALTLFALFVFACNGEDTSNPDGDAPGGGDSIEAASLVGDWLGACLQAPVGSYGDVTEYNFAASNYTLTHHVYNELTCETDRLTLVAAGSYTVGGSVGGVSEIDYSISSYTLTIHEQLLVDYANNNVWGGATDWALDDTRDILGVVFDPGVGIPTLGGTDTVYDIFQVDGDNLYVGDAAVPVTIEGDRPTALGTSSLTRQ